MLRRAPAQPIVMEANPGNTEVTAPNGRALSLHASVTQVNTRINVPAP